MLTTPFLIASLILGQSALAFGWFLAGYWPAGALIAACIPLSLFLLGRKFKATSAIVLGVTVILAALGLWRQMNPLLALGAMICALAAWDLHAFSQRLMFASSEDNLADIEQQHLLRLGMTLLAGMLVNLLTQAFHQKLGFEAIAILAILAFFGIGILITRENTSPPQ